MFNWVNQYLKGQRRTDDRIPIKNFGAFLISAEHPAYRGALPDARGYRVLSDVLGVKVVYSLIDGDRHEDGQVALSSGIEHWSQFPMSDRHRPDPAIVSDFLATAIAQLDRGPFYVHCKGGRHRTGIMVAALRILVDGWSKQEAIGEMKRYSWYGTPWPFFWKSHQPLMDWFINDFHAPQSK